MESSPIFNSRIVYKFPKRTLFQSPETACFITNWLNERFNLSHSSHDGLESEWPKNAWRLKKTSIQTQREKLQRTMAKPANPRIQPIEKLRTFTTIWQVESSEAEARFLIWYVLFVTIVYVIIKYPIRNWKSPQWRHFYPPMVSTATASVEID